MVRCNVAESGIHINSSTPLSARSPPALMVASPRRFPRACSLPWTKPGPLCRLMAAAQATSAATQSCDFRPRESLTIVAIVATPVGLGSNRADLSAAADESFDATFVTCRRDGSLPRLCPGSSDQTGWPDPLPHPGPSPIRNVWSDQTGGGGRFGQTKQALHLWEAPEPAHAAMQPAPPRHCSRRTLTLRALAADD